MDSGEDDDEKRRRGEEVQLYGRAGGLKERMGKEIPSGRYTLSYIPTYTYLPRKITT